MQNNIPTLYILELYSSVVKSAKILTILCRLVQNIKKNIDRVVTVTRRHSQPKINFMQNIPFTDGRSWWH